MRRPKDACHMHMPMWNVHQVHKLTNQTADYSCQSGKMHSRM